MSQKRELQISSLQLSGPANPKTTIRGATTSPQDEPIWRCIELRICGEEKNSQIDSVSAFTVPNALAIL